MPVDSRWYGAVSEGDILPERYVTTLPIRPIEIYYCVMFGILTSLTYSNRAQIVSIAKKVIKSKF